MSLFLGGEQEESPPKLWRLSRRSSRRGEDAVGARASPRPPPYTFFALGVRRHMYQFYLQKEAPSPRAWPGVCPWVGGQFGQWRGLARQWNACRTRWRRRSRRPCGSRGTLRKRPDRASVRSSDWPLEGSRPQGAIPRPTPRLPASRPERRRGEGCSDV